MLRCRPRSQDTLSALMDHEEFDKTGIKDTPSDVFDLNERYPMPARLAALPRNGNLILDNTVNGIYIS